MASLNKVMLIGNLTRDPEIKYTAKGTAVTEISIAVNRTYVADNGERQKETTFVEVNLWGRTAEVAAQHLKKGRPVFIEGRLQMHQWQDKATGQNRSKIRVVADGFEFLDSRSENASGDDTRQNGFSESRPSASPAKPPRASEPPVHSPEDEDEIPF